MVALRWSLARLPGRTTHAKSAYVILVVLTSVRGPLRVAARPPLEQSGGGDVAPDEPGFGGRLPSFRQRAHPRLRRATEAGGEDLRVATEQRPISPRRPHDPHLVDGVRLAVADCNRERLRFSLLPIGRPSRRVDATEHIPALDLNEASQNVIPQADVRG